jgi:hypothetical protein
VAASRFFVVKILAIFGFLITLFNLLIGQRFLHPLEPLATCSFLFFAASLGGLMKL